MKKLNETIISELLNSFELSNDDNIEINIYSHGCYANCNDRLLIGSFIMTHRIGAWLLVQKIEGYEVKKLTDNITQINIFCKDI